MQNLLIPFIRAADEDAAIKPTGRGLTIDGSEPRTVLVESHPPKKLESLLNLQLRENGVGKEGLLDVVQRILQYSVNTWDQGFMDKLYASTNAVRRVDAAAETCSSNQIKQFADTKLYPSGRCRI